MLGHRSKTHAKYQTVRLSREMDQPVEKLLAEITKGNMSLMAERLILWERRGKSKQKGSDGEKAKG